MSSTATYLDMRSRKHTYVEINRLVDFISGDLNEATLAFLHDVCARNPSALQKVLTKLQQIKVELTAEHINRVVESLHKQLLPKDIMSAMQYYLLDQRMNNIVNVFNSVAKKLEKSELVKSTLHMIYSLNLFTDSTPAEEFLRSIIIMILDFQNRDYHHSRDAAKWLRTLLAISDKSDLTKLIDLLADRLQLAGILLNGHTRNMDLSELFFMFEAMATQTELLTPHETNKKLVLNINAIMLTTLVCKKSPTAFYDVVSLQKNNLNRTCIQQIKHYYKNPLVIEQFFQHHGFKNYFRAHSQSVELNQQAFLINLFKHLHTVTNERLDNNLQPIFQFMDHCHKQSQEMDDRAFINWYENNVSQQQLDETLQNGLFNAVEREAATTSTQAGSLIFANSKLISLGFSPRSALVAHTGFFQPLLEPAVPKIDIQNIQALQLFYATLKPKQKKQFTKELLLSTLILQRKMLKKQADIHEASLKTLRRPTHNAFPIPNHLNMTIYMKKSTTSRTARVIHKQPAYTNNFFGQNAKTTPVKYARQALKPIIRHRF